MRIKLRINKNAIARVGGSSGTSPISIKFRRPSQQRAERITAKPPRTLGIRARVQRPESVATPRTLGIRAKIQRPPQALAPPPKHRLEVPIRKLQRSGVPDPQALRRGEYQRKYGTSRDVSPALPKARPATGGVTVLIGPTALNHEGRLRKTGKVSGHWAMYAFLLEVNGQKVLGVQFKAGFRCYYPSTSEYDYRGIVNAESGSYYVWDHIKGKPYITF